MLTIEQIENDEYSKNDVADLMMRFQIAKTSLNHLMTDIFKYNLSEMNDAYQIAVNSLCRIESDHTCSVEPVGECYRCACDLIAAGE